MVFDPSLLTETSTEPDFIIALRWHVARATEHGDDESIVYGSDPHTGKPFRVSHLLQFIDTMVYGKTSTPHAPPTDTVAAYRHRRDTHDSPSDT